jgi:predicted PurR-regulated permease PerM
MKDRTLTVLIALLTAIAVIAALYAARSILTPVTFALFIIAVVWPVQRGLQARMPRLLAMALTVLGTIVVITALSSVVIWGGSRAGQWLIANSARFQTVYSEIAAWLEGHDLFVASLLAEHFNMSWVIRIVQTVGAQFHTVLTFAVVTLVFVILGLLEVEASKRKLQNLENRGIGASLLSACMDISAKFQKYMVIRTVMSLATGAAVWAFASLYGSALALEWGLIAFVLNYIPFLGPLFATVFPTFFAAAQFESWQIALTMFLGLNAIQFMLGSYLEPRIAGKALSISPFMVLFAVFFWSFLWGVPGAFIGVPILIAALTFAEHSPALRPMAALFAGTESDGAPPKQNHVGTPVKVRPKIRPKIK